MQRGGEFCPSPSRPRCYAGGRRRDATGGRGARGCRFCIFPMIGAASVCTSLASPDFRWRRSAIGAWFTIKRTLTIPVVTWPSRARSSWPCCPRARAAGDGQVPDGSAPSPR